MNKKGNVFVIIWIVLLILFFIYLFIIIIISTESHKICKNECSDRGTRFSDIIPNGEAFSLRDLCVCYFEDRMEQFIQGGK